MLLKYIDELAQSDRYDLKADSTVDVYLAELEGYTEDKGLAEWKIVGEELVPRSLLHYDDTADGSNVLNGSWREFFAAECEFGKIPLFSGSNIFYKDGWPNFGGVAKAAIYLRYSVGFLHWIESFDKAAADAIRKEISLFENLIENKKTKKLTKDWVKFKPLKGEKWVLPILCTLSDNTKIVLGLSGRKEDDWDDLIESGVNIERSLEVMSFFTSPKVSGKEIVSDKFQMGSGLGRNAFGIKYKLDKITNSEFTRLMGTVSITPRNKLTEICSNTLEYWVKVAPNPSSSKLVFLPEGDFKYSKLKQFVDSENSKRDAFLSKNKKQNTNEDIERLITPNPSIIPVPIHAKATLFLVNIEACGKNKKKLVIQQVFPGISLNYLSCINQEILQKYTQFVVVEYMKAVLTRKDKDTASVYQYWTRLFTSSLQKTYISAYEIFNNFQRFCKAFSGEVLIGGEKPKAREYFRIISCLRRLQHLIHIARCNPSKLNTNEFNNELTLVEQFKYTEKGVFNMRKDCPKPIELVGEVYDSLWDWQKEKLDAFVIKAWHGIPDEDFDIFIRGALTGMLLSHLNDKVTKSGRKFSVTQGRHPSTLRGEQIVSVVTKGIGLLINLEEQNKYNCNTLPFINSCVEDSRKDIFNSGLIMGLVYNN